MAKQIINSLSLGLIILLFSYTGVAKLVELQKFVFQLGRSPFTLLREMAPILSIGLPVVELFTVLLLIAEDVKTIRFDLPKYFTQLTGIKNKTFCFDLPKYITLITRIRNPKRTGLYIAFTILSIFTIYLTIMLLSRVHLPCTCGGIITKLSWKGHLALNVGFLLLTLFLLRSKQDLQFEQKNLVSPNMQ